MTQSKSSCLKLLWTLPPVIIGIIIFIVLVKNRQAPQEVLQQAPAKAVRVISASKVSLTPWVEGFGIVQPAKVWTAVAQVEGRVIKTHANLRNGTIIPKGEFLYQIDPVDYELTIAQVKSELSELMVEEANAKDSLAIEQKNLILASKEFKRLQKLVKQKVASKSSMDEKEQIMLSKNTLVQNLKNNLALLPTKRKYLEAKLAQARRDLSHTTVNAPFNLRIANLNMETDQYVTKGQTLFQGDSVDQVEIIAHFPISNLRNLFMGKTHTKDVEYSTEKLKEFTGFKPVVKLDMGQQTAEWQAEFVRFSDNVDSQTRTMGVVITVDDPFGQMLGDQVKPPLSKGMFVQVLLYGDPQADRIILPRAAIRNGKVYTVNAKQRMQSQAVSILFNQGDISVIASGIKAEDKIIVSDLVPAVEGMLLLPQNDPVMQQRLQLATGQPHD